MMWKSSLALLFLVACADPPPGGGGGDEPDDVTDANDVPPDDIDAAPPSEGCGEWRTGTLTGYNNSDLGDDPNAGSVMEFTGLNDSFYNNVDMAAIDFGDWGADKYHWVEVDFEGTLARVGVWDACRNEDCPDGNDCCTDNKTLFANPGYLVDVETRTAQRLFGVWDAESTLRDEIRFRVCEEFDPDQIAQQYGAYRW